LIEHPEISVILPVYNCERFVKDAVQSILDQTNQDFEFIIIDDGSKDRTNQILSSISDSRIRLIARENRGFARSLNEAIALSRGEFIARMDADDISLADRLQLQSNFMRLNPAVDILGGQIIVVDENDVPLGIRRNPVTWHEIKRRIESECPIFHPTYFVRKKAYALTNGYRTVQAVDDYDFLLRAFECGCVMANLDVPVLRYRQVMEGMTMSNLQRNLVLTSLVKKMHKLRLSGKQGEEELMRRANAYSSKPGPWFQFVFNLKETLTQKQKRSPEIRIPIVICKFLLSLLHYQIFLITLRSVKQREFVLGRWLTPRRAN
jgi:glycosyltransferase involved in cell wall biosynthesis